MSIASATAPNPSRSRRYEEYLRDLREQQMLRTQEVTEDRIHRKSQISEQLRQQGLDDNLDNNDHTLHFPQLDTDRYMTLPDYWVTHYGWYWNPRSIVTTRTPPGKRVTVRDVPDLEYKPHHNLWIQESLRMRPYWRHLMCVHRTKDSYTAFDIGNDRWAVM